jgi:alcohol dehydrogenase YqhD (iron-dependent ADH family)
VSHWGLAIYIEKYLKAKEELWKLKYFAMQNHNLQKNPLKETKIFQGIRDLRRFTLSLGVLSPRLLDVSVKSKVILLNLSTKC